LSNTKTGREMATIMLVENYGKNYLNGDILHVGCGRKPLKRLYPQYNWVGLDIRPVGDIVGDAHAMPIEDAAYDTVVCLNVLQKCASPVMVVRECARVLKPGGHLLLSAPNTFMDDHKSLWNIKLAGMDYLISQAGLKGVDEGIRGEGRLFSVEFNAFKRYYKFAFNTNDEFQGWLDEMDLRYPVVSLAIAVKEG